MNLEERINVLIHLGTTLRNEIKKNSTEQSVSFSALLEKTCINNPWFDKHSVTFALNQLALLLDKNKLVTWISQYEKDSLNRAKPKNIAIIMAGNIPLVGFHDFLCVLIAGHKASIKMSSQDNILLPYLVDIITKKDERFKDYIHFYEKAITNFDAVIATGGDNTARYFEYYFNKYPNIIRKNRNSIAILNGNESFEELSLLADDMCLFFGKGCRSISHLIIPKDYDFSLLTKALQKYDHMLLNTKYFNNYEYNKAIYIVNKEAYIDTGILMFLNKPLLNPPVSVVHYSYYSESKDIKSFINNNINTLQCIVGNTKIENAKTFGTAQKPNLNDYADNIDTIKFLLHL